MQGDTPGDYVDPVGGAFEGTILAAMAALACDASDCKHVASALN